MYCPNCGSKNNKKQNYCRFCGFNLEETAKSLIKQLSFGERAYKLKKYEQFGRIINLTSETLTLLFVIGLVVILILDFQQLKLFLKISLGIFILFQIVSTGFKHLQNQKAKQLNKPFPEGQKEIISNETNKLLEEKPFEPISSITENPTELLFVENKTRKMN